MREWWEIKFNNLRKKGHRFNYEDLTSGNFSISSQLFKKSGGFNTIFPCRDDYELGYRLIEAGAEFHFAPEAKSLHNDKVTDLRRSLSRKKAEAWADLQFQKMHPEVRNYNAHVYMYGSFKKSAFLRIIQFAPSVTDRIANSGFSVMNFCEKLTLYTSWSRLSYLLHQYWYLRGLIETAGSVKKAREIISSKKVQLKEEQKLTINLQQDLKETEKKLDNVRPLELNVYYGKKFIGTVEHEPGNEPIRGIHLRQLLKEKFPGEIFSVLSSDISIDKPVDNVKEKLSISQ